MGWRESARLGAIPGCAAAFLGQEPWVVTDAATNPRTLANSLVAGKLGLRFCTGVPLTTNDGHNLGTLCVCAMGRDRSVPRDPDALSNLASLVMDQLELQLSARRALALAETRHDQTQDLATALQRSLLPPLLPEIPHVALAAAYHPAANRSAVTSTTYSPSTATPGGDHRRRMRQGAGCPSPRALPNAQPGSARESISWRRRSGRLMLMRQARPQGSSGLPRPA
jgi:hypothetical protein